MAHDRLVPCEYYIAKGNCSKGKYAEHNGVCQHCTKYKLRKGAKKLVKELKHKYKEKKYKEKYYKE